MDFNIHFAKKAKVKYRYRSAVTGKFVSRWYALRHPKRTVKEAVK